MKLEPLEMNVVFEPVTEKTGCHRMQTLVRRQRMIVAVMAMDVEWIIG